MVSTRVHPLKEVHSNKMEIDMVAPRVVDVRRRATMLDRKTLLERGIHILDLDIFMWI
jgi:hypothetical protein